MSEYAKLPSRVIHIDVTDVSDTIASGIRKMQCDERYKHVKCPHKRNVQSGWDQVNDPEGKMTTYHKIRHMAHALSRANCVARLYITSYTSPPRREILKENMDIVNALSAILCYTIGDDAKIMHEQFAAQIKVHDLIVSQHLDEFHEKETKYQLRINTLILEARLEGIRRAKDLSAKACNVKGCDLQEGIAEDHEGVLVGTDLVEATLVQRIENHFTTLDPDVDSDGVTRGYLTDSDDEIDFEAAVEIQQNDPVPVPGTNYMTFPASASSWTTSK